MYGFVCSTANSGPMMILWLAVIFGMMYFLFIRPQKKQMDQRNQMLEALSQGDRIISVGGITGIIRAVTEEFIYVEIAEGLVVEMTKQGVASVQDDITEEDDEYDEPEALEEGPENEDNPGR